MLDPQTAEAVRIADFRFIDLFNLSYAFPVLHFVVGNGPEIFKAFFTADALTSDCGLAFVQPDRKMETYVHLLCAFGRGRIRTAQEHDFTGAPALK